MNGKQAKRLRWKARYNLTDQPRALYNPGSPPVYMPEQTWPNGYVSKAYKLRRGVPTALNTECSRFAYQVLKKGYKIRVKP